MAARATAPEITAPPQPRTVVVGGSYNFTVTVTGTEPLAYQWRHDGIDLAGKTSPSLSLTSISTNEAGLYSVVVTNVDGMVTSATARLTVRLPSDPAYPAPYPGWAYLFAGNSVSNSFTEALDTTWDHSTDSWAGDGRGPGNDLSGGVSTTNGVMTIEDAVASGTSANNRRYYFTHNLAQESSITNQATLLSDGVTLTFRARLTPPTDPWIELTNAPNGLINNSDGKGMFGLRQSGGGGLIIGFSLNQALEDTTATANFNFGQAGLHMNNLNGNSRSAVVDPGEAGTVNLRPLDPTVFHEFWITIQDNGADPGTHRVSIYLDGSTTPSVFNVTAGSGVDGPAANYLALGMGSTAQRGSVDVDFFGYQAGLLTPSTFNQPVGLSAQPTNQMVAIGQNATFAVGVTGTPPYAIQWYRDGAAIGNATNLTYTTPPTSGADEGAQFTVVVSNEFNSVTSSPPALLLLLSAPVITSQPQSLTVTNGDNASFTVTVSSGSPPAYQWRRNESNLANATGSTLLIAGAGSANAGNYDVIVSNNSGSVTSAVATLTVVIFDFGDAPDSGLVTLKSSNGARHIVVPGIHLGLTIDGEVDGQPGPAATGDDLAGIDDEDGVNFVAPLRAGEAASVEVFASTNGILNAWIDYDRNGTWSVAGEQVFTNLSIAAGTNLLLFTVPGAVSPGSTYARFRFHTAGESAFNGPATDGEVEDYTVTISAVANLGVVPSAAPDPVATQSNLTYSITIHNNGPSMATDVTLSDALPANVSFVSALATQGSCSQNGGVVTCALGMLGSGASVGVTLVVVPNGAGSLTNTVTVSAAELDLVPVNNSAVSVTVVLDAPAISTQPESQTVIVGATADFTATASGSAPLSFQWSKGGVDLADATNSSLSIPNAQLADAGNYRLRVTNQVGGADSQVATLTVLSPPAITTPPESRTNFAGSSALFSVTATGTAPLHYQWLFNSTNLVGSDSASLSVPNVQLTNAGGYRVAISNAAGIVTSTVATLTVIEMDFGDAPDGYPTSLAVNGARHYLSPGIRLGAQGDFEPDAVIDLNGTGDDLGGLDDEDGVTFNTVVRAGASVSVSVVASTNGFLNAWLDFNRSGSWAESGEQIFTNHVLVPGDNALSFVAPSTASAGLSFARFRFSTAGGDSFAGEANDGEVEDHRVSIETAADVLVVGVTQLNPAVVGSNQVYTITLSNAGPSIATGVVLADTLPPGLIFTSANSLLGNCTHSAGLVSCSLGTLGAGENGTVVITVIPQTAGSLTNVATVGALQTDPSPANNSVTSIASAFVFPQITAQPQSRTLTNGGTGSFSVTANGTALHYQWKQGATDVPDATNAVLTIANAQPGDAGDYSVTVSNAVGAVTSVAVSLTVLVPVAITTQPQTQTAPQGTTVTFTVTATGSSPLDYQWQFDGADLSGETQSSLTLNNVQPAHAGTYRVRITNPAGSVFSANATLAILVPPQFLTQPQSRTNYAGASATFLTVVEGTQPIHLQWFFNATNLLANQTNAVLTLTNLQGSFSGEYTVVATNLAGAATSSIAVLTVYEVDFGDAPETLGYPTVLDFNGARHRLLPGVRLGLAADFETNGQPNLTATGDDVAGTDDEDGITFPFPLLVGQMVNIAVVASTNGFIDAWVDFDRNGTWADPSEQVLSNRPVEAGTNVISIPISASAIIGNTFARFRFSSTGGLSYDGYAANGEVEDHAVSIQSAIDLAVTSTDSPNPVAVSGTAVYSIVVTNRGPSPGTAIVLTNSLPGSFTFLSATPSQGSCSHNSGTVVCSLGSLAVNGAATLTLSARANAPGTFALNSRVSATEGEVNAVDNLVVQQTSVIVPAAAFSNLQAVSIADGTTTSPGTGNPYPSTVTVSGLTGAVYKVTATLNNLSHSFAADLDVLLVGPGGQSVLLMSDAGGGFVLGGVTPTFDDDAELTLPNSGVISSTSYRPTAYDPTTDAFPVPAPAAPFGSSLSVFKGTDPNGAWSLYVIDDEASDTGTLGGGWRLNISTADPISDLSVVGVGSSNPVALNSNLVYTVVVTNRGPAAATGIVLSNTLPAGVNFISAIPAQGTCAQQGGVVTCQLGGLNPSSATSIALTVRPIGAAVLTNTMRVTGNQLDFVSSNNLATLVTMALPATDVAVAQTASTNLTLMGEQLTYTLNVTNLGPETAVNVQVVDPLPPNVSFVSANTSQGSCTNDAGIIRCALGTMAAGSRVVINLVIEPTATGSLTNRASVLSDEIDSAAGNNFAKVVTTVNVAADLTMALLDAPNPVAIGSSLVYSIAVTNLGPSTASAVQVSDPLPANVTFVSAVSSQGVCTNDNGILRCALGSLLAGESAAISLSVIPNAAGLLTNSASLSANSVDPSPANNFAARVTSVLIPPSIITGPLSQIVTSSVNVAFTVTANGSAPLQFQWQFDGTDLADATNATLILNNVTFGAGGSYQVRVTNDVGSVLSGVALLTVLVPPTLSDIASQQTDEDTPVPSIAFTIGDVDSGADALTLTRLSSNPSLVPVENIVLTGSGSSRQMEISPALNQSGTSTITIEVRDPNGLMAADSFLVTVAPVNDLPTLADITDQITAEDTPLTVSITASDVETLASELVVAALSSNEGLVPVGGIGLERSGTNWLMTLHPATNQSGTSTITVSVTDTNGASVNDSFLFTVHAVNDPPAFDALSNLTIVEDAALQSVPLTGITTGASGELQTLVFDVVSGNTNLVANASILYTNGETTGVLSFSPLPNAHGGVTLTVTLNDGGDSNQVAVRTFDVLVISSNDLPRVSSLLDLSVLEDTSTGLLSFTLEDVETEAGNLSLLVSSSDTNLVPLANIQITGSGTNRTISLQPAGDRSGVTLISLAVTDEDGGISVEEFQLTVEPVNDSPLLANVADQLTVEDVPVSFALAVSDAETSVAALSVSVVSSNDVLVPPSAINILNDGSIPLITITPAANQSGTAVLTVVIGDGTNTVTDEVLFTVISVNDGPTLDAIEGVTVGEDSGLRSLSLSGISAGPTNENQTLVVSVSAANPALFASLAVDYTDPATTGVLSFAPAANASGSTMVTVTLNDGGATNHLFSRSFVVDITPTNDLPVLAAGGDRSTPEDVPLSLLVSASDVESSFASLTLTASSSDTNVVPTAAIVITRGETDWSVTIAPAPDQSGTVSIALLAQDGDGGSNSVAFVLSVEPVNDVPTLAPIANQTLLIGVTTRIIPLSEISSGAANENQPLSVTAISSEPSLVPTVEVNYASPSSNGSLTITAAPNSVGTAIISVTVNDGAETNNTVTRTFNVAVGVVNSPPSVSSIADLTIAEDAATNVTFTIGDAESTLAELTLSVASSNAELLPTNNLSFSGTGSLRTLHLIPASNQFGTANLTFQVSDPDGGTTTRSFLVSIMSVNDAPTMTALAPLTIAEDAGVQTLTLSGISAGAANEIEILNLTAISSDPSIVPHPSIVYLNPESTATLSFSSASNASGSVTITVTADDGQTSNRFSAQTFTVNVTPVNDAPVLGAVPAQSTEEDVARVIPLLVTDDVSPAALLSVTAHSSDTNLFPAGSLSVSNNEGSFTLHAQPASNRVGSAAVILVATDPQSLSGSNSFVLTVNPVNDRPTISAIAPQVVDEDTNGLVVSLVVDDLETLPGNLVLSYSTSNPGLVPAASLVFAGTGANRTLTITPAPDQTGVATIEITVRDEGGAAATTSFVLTVNPLNDPPAISFLGDQSVAEDGVLSFAFAISDRETLPGSLSLSALSSNSGLLPSANIQLGNANGNVLATLRPATNQAGTSTVTFVLTDGGGLTVSNSFQLSVSAVNDAPTLNPLSDLSLNEDAGSQSVSLNGIGSGAPDEAQTLAVSATTTNPNLLLNLAVNHANPAATGTLTFVPAPNATGTAAITVTVNDGGASNNLVSRTFNVTINSTNDAPTISALSNQTINEDTVLTLPVVVTDAETPPYQLVLTAVSTNTTLLANTNIVFHGDGTDRVVTLIPSSNQFGVTLVTVVVSDGARTATNSFLLTVTAVNDPPTLNPLTDMVFTGNPSGQTVALSGITSGAANETETLVVTASSSNTALIPTPTPSYTSPSTTGSISFNPANAGSGLAVITVTVTGAGGTSVSRSFTAYFRAGGNTPPTITNPGNQTVAEDASTGPLNITIGDSATAADLLTLAGSSSNTNVVLNSGIAFGGSGTSRTVTVTPLPNRFGTTAITLSVTDSAFGHTTNIFLITVTSLNDLPTLSSIPDQVVVEDNATSILPVVIGDVETVASQLVVTAVSTNTALVPNGNISLGGSGTNRALVVTPIPNQSGTTLVTVTVNDGAGGVSNRSFRVTVNSTNDLPVISTLAHQIVSEDSGGGPVLFTISDVETSAANLLLSIVSSNPALLPDNNVTFGGSGSSRTLSFIPLANQSGEATLVLTVTDGNGGMATTSFGVTVLSLNDPPTLDALGNLTVTQSAASQVVNLTGIGTGASGENQTLVVTATSSRPDLLPTPEINYISPNASGTLTLRPRGGTNGSGIVTVTVNDGSEANGSVSRSFTFSVNDAPLLSAIANQSLDEDVTSLPIPFTVNDPETAAESLTLTATSSDTNLVAATNILIQGTGANRTVTLRPGTNQFGHATITIKAEDGSGNSSAIAFELVVRPINDAPALNPLPDLNLAEEAPAQVVNLTGLRAGPTNEVQDLSVTVVSSNPGLIESTVDYLSPSPNGILTLLPRPNAAGSAVIQVIVSDGQSFSGTVTQAFTVVVGATNDLPTLSLIPDQSMDENGSLIVGFLIGDAETPSDSLSVSASSSNSALLPSANIVSGGGGGNRALRLSPTAGQFGTSTVEVTVTDAEGGFSSRSFVLTVRAVTLPIIITQPESRTVTNGATVSFAVGVSPTGPLSYQWRHNGEDIAGATASTLILGQVQALDAGFYEVRVSNSAGTTTSDAATLRVLLPPTIIAITQSGTTASLSFLTVLGLNYTVEFKDSVDALGWNVLPTLPGTGGEVVVSDPAADVPARVYRIRVE